MNSKWISTGLLSIIVALPLCSWAGVNSSGGGDRFATDFGSAWFTGAGKPIPTCLVVSQSFPVSESELKAEITEAFLMWEKYYNSHHTGSYSDQVRGASLDFNVKLLDHCDGSEALKFYFGAEDAAVLNAKTQFQDPLALSSRTSYDMGAGFGRGLVWVQTPREFDTTEEYTNDYIFGLIAHELGHVMGCGHVAGTIMDEKVADHFSPWKWRYDRNIKGYRSYQMTTSEYHRLVRSIDFQRQLSLTDMNYFKSGVFDGHSDEHRWEDYLSDVTQLMDRPVSGEVQMSLDTRDGQEMILTFKDDLGSVSVKIFPSYIEGVSSGDESPVFNSVTSLGEKKWLGGQMMVGDAQIQSATGELLPVRIMFNAGDTWVVQLLRRNGSFQTHTLFRSNPRLTN